MIDQNQQDPKQNLSPEMKRIQLTSTIIECMPSGWKVEHTTFSGKLLFTILGHEYSLLLSSSRNTLAEVTYEEEKSCLMLHPYTACSNDQKNIIKSSLERATHLPVYLT